LTNVDAEHDEFEVDHVEWGDALKWWSYPIMTALDEPSHQKTVHTARWSPLISKLITDAAYMRAIFGSISAILPAMGVVLGVFGVISTNHQMLPPALAITTAIAVVGVLDAFAGFIGMSVFIVGSVIMNGLHSAGDIRMLAGLAAIGFAPGLLVTAFRGIRRAKAESMHDWWERVTDIAVGSFLGGWTVKGIVGALSPLAGVKLPISDSANTVAIAVAAIIPLRIVLEEIAAQWFPSRLNAIHPTYVKPTSLLQKCIALALRASAFMFVASAFIGWTWQLAVGTTLFILPAYVGLFQDRLPNIPRLYQVLPAGIPGLAFALLVASYSMTAMLAVFGATPNLAKMAFVLLPIPSLLFSFLGMLGREPEEGDRRWYQREKWLWLYRIGGVAMLVYTMHLAGIF
jgi:hypothetical protein